MAGLVVPQLLSGAEPLVTLITLELPRKEDFLPIIPALLTVFFKRDNLGPTEDDLKR
jgi:hypothetical protein